MVPSMSADDEQLYLTVSVLAPILERRLALRVGLRIGSSLREDDAEGR